MNRKLLAAALIASGLVAPAAIAADTHTVNVQAQVVGTCKFNSAGPTLINISNGGAGSTIDPSLTGAGNATGTADILFRCTANTTSAMQIAGVAYPGAPVARTLTAPGPLTMAYTVELVGHAQAGGGFGAGGADRTLTVNAAITEATWSAAGAGTYADSFVLTVTP